MTSTTTSLSNQALDGAVSGIDVAFGAPEDGGDQNGALTTGDVNAGGAAFGGVQTASYNTGVGALNQAATSLSANANITFGGGTAP